MRTTLLLAQFVGFIVMMGISVAGYLVAVESKDLFSALVFLFGGASLLGAYLFVNL